MVPVCTCIIGRLEYMCSVCQSVSLFVFILTCGLLFDWIILSESIC